MIRVVIRFLAVLSVLCSALVVAPNVAAGQNTEKKQAQAAKPVPPVRDASCARSASVIGLRMKYEAYIAGVNAGEATLRLTRDGATYRVAGSARSKGLWESLQQWRAEYAVDGVIAPRGSVAKEASLYKSAQLLDKSAQPLHKSAQLLDKSAQPLPKHFYSLQTTPNKRREIHIEDGVLRETKNNKQRDPRPAQTGYDLLSALFFLPACHEKARVHTGRDGYEFTRVADGAGQGACNYTVVDEDGDSYLLGMTYKQLDKTQFGAQLLGDDQLGTVSVPMVISVQGPLPGRMVLVESAPIASAPGCSTSS